MPIKPLPGCCWSVPETDSAARPTGQSALISLRQVAPHPDVMATQSQATAPPPPPTAVEREDCSWTGISERNPGRYAVARHRRFRVHRHHTRKSDAQSIRDATSADLTQPVQRAVP
jgi:hypothetical protein